MNPRRLATLTGLALLVAGQAALGDTFEFSGTTMTSVFAEGREQTVLRGQARIVSESVEITADQITISGKEFRFAECSGSVVVIDHNRDLTLTCRGLSYDRRDKVMTATGTAVLEDRKNAVIVKGDRIENRENEDLVILQVGVRILKKDLSGRAEYVRYDRASSRLELSGLPVVYRKRDEYRAARIIVNLDTEEISLQGEVKGTITSDE